jgi:hypothetical protein
MILFFIFSAALLLVTGIGAWVVKKEVDMYERWIKDLS